MSAKPILWHIPVSHYNEKARWALGLKGVEHERRAPVPSAHMAVALWLTRGACHTFPVLRLDGRNIGDSTAIIAALEARVPDPPLYPSDPAERRRALELEDFFDEQLGPHVRLLAWHEILADSGGNGMERITEQSLPPALARIGVARRAMGRAGSAFVSLRFGARDDDAAQLAREQVVAALDRLEAELAGGEYLVGDSFSVADLTAASLLYPLVLPPEGPAVFEALPPALEAFVAPMRERPGWVYVGEMFRRHRRPVPAPVA